MRFTVVHRGSRRPAGTTDQVLLYEDNWNDWFTYQTMYYLSYVDSDGTEHDIGQVKIGQFEQRSSRPDVPDEFTRLSDNFFSLGQDPTYYENLNLLGYEFRQGLLTALHDVALDDGLYAKASKEGVFHRSLMRSVPETMYEGQLRRMANGGARLTPYAFSYTFPPDKRMRRGPLSLSFRVRPESNPPSNIHVIIGRNGAGKTRMLTLMTHALVNPAADPSAVGSFDVVEQTGEENFSNVVSVAFSAFDELQAEPPGANSRGGVRYTYVGLRRQQKPGEEVAVATKSPQLLSREFGESVEKICEVHATLLRWKRALGTLEADPIFAEAEVADSEWETNPKVIRRTAQEKFNNLSSGHKIVLLTITKLVETVEERTLVVLDEPEAHLHPPLLSAFVRALSDLLVDRNGVAIIATHSPVVLQEVPSDCVWKIRRIGRSTAADRPDIQTFGENVGVLTREVFGLEVSQSGYHRLIQDAVTDGLDYGEILDRFEGSLGGEAKGLAQALVAIRGAEASV